MKDTIKQNLEIVKIVKEASKNLHHKKWNGKIMKIPKLISK
jgi:hypothetical protein